MPNNQFKTPLLQSAAILGGVILLFNIVSSSGTAHEAGAGSVFLGIFHLIMFVIGMAVALGFCIAVLIGIFLGAVGMVDPGQAGQMYGDLKKNFSRIR